MKRSHLHWIASVLLAVTLGVAGCTSADEPEGDSVGDTAAQVDAGDGSQPATITITEDAEDRLGIETTPVVAGPAKSGRPATLVIPYAAVVYDADGEAWTFAAMAPLTYKRAPIVVASIGPDTAILSNGPPPGTAVVTVGASELVGMEAGISGEE
jgi:hypothetical protein